MEPGANARVAVLYGGYWDERDSSVATAQRVHEALVADGLAVVPVRWDAEGWVTLPTTTAGSDPVAWLDPAPSRPPTEVVHDLKSQGLGVVFNCLHGGPGADGTLQGFLELASVPYTGAGVYGSALCSNRESFRWAAQGCGLEVAMGMVVERESWLREADDVMTQISLEVGYPVVLKPILASSGAAVARANDPEELHKAMEALYDRERCLLVEQFVDGREIVVSCLGSRAGQGPQVLLPVEIAADVGGGVKLTPNPENFRRLGPHASTANLDSELLDHVEMMVAALHQCMDLGAASRTGMILGADGVVVLGSSTTPYLGVDDCFSKSIEAEGLDFTTLCRRMIDHALSAHLARGMHASTGGLL